MIYTLTDPRDSRVRYVGVSKDNTTTLNSRLSRHIHEAKHLLHKKSHRTNWIRSVLRDGLKPIVELLDEGSYEEEIYWISQFKAWGFDLVNGTDGGEHGTLGRVVSTEGRERLMFASKIRKRVLNLTTGIEYESINQASRETGIPPSKVSYSCNNKPKGKNAQGYGRDRIYNFKFI